MNKTEFVANYILDCFRHEHSVCGGSYPGPSEIHFPGLMDHIKAAKIIWENIECETAREVK